MDSDDALSAARLGRLESHRQLDDMRRLFADIHVRMVYFDDHQRHGCNLLLLYQLVPRTGSPRNASGGQSKTTSQEYAARALKSIHRNIDGMVTTYSLCRGRAAAFTRFRSPGPHPEAGSRPHGIAFTMPMGSLSVAAAAADSTSTLHPAVVLRNSHNTLEEIASSGPPELWPLVRNVGR